MNKSEHINELATALSKAQGKMANAKKDSENPFFKSKYADLASVWDACREALSQNGLSIAQISGDTDGKSVKLVTTLMHSSGQWIEGTLVMIPTKPGPQEMGSCLKYARRYALAAIVGIADEDDDGQKASIGQIKSYSSMDISVPPHLQYAEYYPPAGKYAGIKIKDIEPEELASYIEFQINKSVKDGRPMSQEMKKFIEYADTYLTKTFPAYEAMIK